MPFARYPSFLTIPSSRHDALGGQDLVLEPDTPKAVSKDLVPLLLELGVEVLPDPNEVIRVPVPLETKKSAPPTKADPPPEGAASIPNLPDAPKE